MITPSHIQLIFSHDFPLRAARDIAKSHQRVVLVTTTLHNDCPETEKIAQALEAAARRGVNVTVLADTLTYTEVRGSLLNISSQQRRGLEAIRLERRLRKAGIHFYWLGKNSNIGFAGRTHCKWIIADDIVYSFGGINTDRVSFENIDFMLRIKDSDLSRKLASESRNIQKGDQSGRGMRNHQFGNRETKVLIDGGLPFNSLIYQRACDLAKEATAIMLVSQYSPTGKLAHLIKKCPEQTLYFNHIRNATFLNSIILSLGFLNRQTNHYNHSAYLHAKYILFTLKDGHKVALLGSHNFVFSSGLIGTHEIAMETTNAHIINLLETFTAQHVV